MNHTIERKSCESTHRECTYNGKRRSYKKKWIKALFFSTFLFNSMCNFLTCSSLNLLVNERKRNLIAIEKSTK